MPGNDRLKAGAGVAIVHALLGYAFLLGLIGHGSARPEPELKLFDISEPPPPPPERKPPPAPKRAKRSGAAAPRNLKAQPTEIVSPPPVVPLVLPPPVVAAKLAGAGAAPSAGASDRRGPGTGAGGFGNGRGSGGYGDGDGDGGTPPRQVGGRIRNSDFPRALDRAGVGGTVSVRYRVGIDGRVSNCIVTGSSGSEEADALTCRLIEERFRFKPERDRDGRPVPSIIVENHSWIMERDVLPLDPDDREKGGR